MSSVLVYHVQSRVWQCVALCVSREKTHFFLLENISLNSSIHLQNYCTSAIYLLFLPHLSLIQVVPITYIFPHYFPLLTSVFECLVKQYTNLLRYLFYYYYRPTNLLSYLSPGLSIYAGQGLTISCGTWKLNISASQTQWNDCTVNPHDITVQFSESWHIMDFSVRSIHFAYILPFHSILQHWV